MHLTTQFKWWLVRIMKSKQRFFNSIIFYCSFAVHLYFIHAIIMCTYSIVAGL